MTVSRINFNFIFLTYPNFLEKIHVFEKDFYLNIVKKVKCIVEGIYNVICSAQVSSYKQVTIKSNLQV